MSVGEFPLSKTDMSVMSGISWNARPKKGRGGKKTPRAFRGGKKKKSPSFGKKKFSVGWKNKMLVGKKNFGWKKMLVGEFTLPKNGKAK